MDNNLSNSPDPGSIFPTQINNNQNPLSNDNPPNPQSLQPSTDSPTQTPDSPKPQYQPKKKLFLALLGMILALTFLCLGIITVAIAYDKIEIPKYPKLQNAITLAVMSIPYTPKTPRYLLTRTVIAHKDITKHSFDISIAMESQGLTAITGLSKTEALAQGSINYQNPENIIFSANIALTKDFNFEIKKPNQILYFKINKIPSYIPAAFGMQIDQFDPIIGKWVSYDTTGLETKASEELNKDKEVKTPSEEIIEGFESNFLKDQLVKKLKVEKVKEDKNNFYKLTIDFDKKTLDELEKILRKDSAKTLYQDGETRLSDVIKKMSWSIFINTKTYLTHKIVVTSESEFDKINSDYSSPFLGTSETLPQNSKFNFAMVIQFDNFGEEINVSPPSDAITFDEFLELFSKIVAEIYKQISPPATPESGNNRN
jgi:hypothetical protein